MRQPQFNRGGPGQRAQAGFQKINRQQRTTLRRLFGFVMHHYKGFIAIVLLCIVVSSVTSLVSSLFTRTLIDDYVVPLTQADNPEYASLLQALFKLGLVLLFGVVCSYAYNRLMIEVSQGTMLRLRKQLFQHMEKLPISYFDTHPHGELMSVYTNDVDSLRQVISTSMAQVFNSVITITVTLVSMLVLSVPLTLVSILMAVVMMIATTKLGTWSRGYFRTQQESLARVNSFIEEMMTGQRVVKTFCHEQQAISEFEAINEQLRSSASNANKIANIVMPVNGNLGNLGYVFIAVVGASLALGQFSIVDARFTVSLGTIVAFLQLNKSFTQPITHVSQQINSVLNALVGAERVFRVIDAEPEEDRGRQELHQPKGDVDFRHVDFGYVPEKQVLFDININTQPGQKIAFVGGTGAGKTTIINLINRFYNVVSGSRPTPLPLPAREGSDYPQQAESQEASESERVSTPLPHREGQGGGSAGSGASPSGVILYDGIPVNDIRLDSLRHSMSIVLQETHLFTASVLDNIRYGRLDATDEECREAARLVGADDFIRRLAEGYDTLLSGDGGNLSQGERQLLAIARAAVANPPVLILDEATSSIDTHTEQLVQRGMDSIMKGRTTFVIAHRLSTVRNADQIIVLDHGRIIEHGSHDELLRQRGQYYQLYTGDTSLLT